MNAFFLMKFVSEWDYFAAAQANEAIVATVIRITMTTIMIRMNTTEPLSFFFGIVLFFFVLISCPLSTSRTRLVFSRSAGVIPLREVFVCLFSESL
jgi:hypothetical protein